MSQYDFGTINPATKSGTALASDLNSWRDALHSTHAGSSAPSYLVAGMLWVDTTSANYELKMYDGAQWINIAILDATNNVARVAVDPAETSYITSTTSGQIRHLIASTDIFTTRATGIQFNIASPVIADSNNNELISFTTTASAVNQINITNSATTVAPIISAVGNDTNINIAIAPKGTGVTHAITETAATNTVIDVARIEARSSGTPAAGIGAGLLFAVETSASNFEIGARIEAVTTDVTATSEDFDVVIKSMAGGSAAAERARLTSTGYLRLASGSGGIQFGGDTAAANALDDYEEGTFTPVVADAVSGGNVATASTAAGQYTKIGNLVFIDVQLVDIGTTGMTAGNTIHIRGLPFTSKNTANALTYFGGAFTSTNSTTGVVFGAAPGNGTYMTIREGLTTGSANLTVAALVSGAADIRLSGCYIAA